MIRKSTINLKFANIGKLKKLKEVAGESSTSLRRRQWAMVIAAFRKGSEQ